MYSLLPERREIWDPRHPLPPCSSGRDDFYVQYKLVAVVENPVDRPVVASALHTHPGRLQCRGLQIMSPHFALQPRKPVLGELKPTEVGPQDRAGTGTFSPPRRTLRFSAFRRSPPLLQTSSLSSPR